jgi:hypothetical protein
MSTLVPNPDSSTDLRKGAKMDKKLGLLLISLVLFVLVALGACHLAGPDSTAARYGWVVGAGALGLMTGLVTGASNQAGIGGQLLTFVSGGILVPLFGGVVALMQFRQGTREEYTYAGEHVATKTTSVFFPTGVEPLHPIWVLGAFFALYGSAAILGILLGVLLRESGFAIKMTDN